MKLRKLLAAVLVGVMTVSALDVYKRQGQQKREEASYTGVLPQHASDNRCTHYRCQQH